MPTFVSIAAQYENLGDELINGIMLNELCKRGLVYAYNAGAPDWYVNALFKYLENPENLVLLSSGRQLVSSILSKASSGEASQIFLSCGHHPNDGFPSQVKSLALKLATLFPSLDVVVIGASCYDPSFIKRYLLTGSKRRPSKSYVRDRRSEQAFQMGTRTIGVTPDLAYKLPFERPGSARSKVVISIRTDLLHLGDARKAIVSSLVEQIRKEGLDPVFYCQVGRDREGMKNLAARHNAELVEALPNTENRLEVAQSLFDTCAAVVGNRLHALMLGASRGAFPVSLQSENNGKIQGAFEEGNLQYARIDFNASDLPEDTMLQVLQGGDTNRLRDAFEASSALIDQTFDRMIGQTSRAATR